MFRAAPDMTIRRAIPSDREAIDGLLCELELVRPSLSVECFWVAEEGGEVVGIAHIEPAGDHFFVSSVGVREARQERGVGTRLLKKMLSGSDRRVYLYTIIPDFFERLGFRVAPAPRALPPRELFGCDACEKNRCVCMVRPPDVSELP